MTVEESIREAFRRRGIEPTADDVGYVSYVIASYVPRKAPTQVLDTSSRKKPSLEDEKEKVRRDFPEAEILKVRDTGGEAGGTIDMSLNKEPTLEDQIGYVIDILERIYPGAEILGRRGKRTRLRILLCQ